MVILSAAASGNQLEKTAHAVREAHELLGVSLVAVLDPLAASRAPALSAAGFDAVLVKPVAYAELEQLIDA